VREIIDNPGPHFEALTRVRYRVIHEPWSWERLAEDVKQQSRSCLVILNTKKDALEVLDTLKEGENVRHLSTLLCGAHRRAVLKEVKQSLEAERSGNGTKTILVTTQVVDAGVDLDFPLVYRSVCPLSSAIQAAGRCNREGRRDRDECLVTLFKPLEGGMPTGEAYRLASELAWNHLTAASEVNLDDPETPPAYFAELFSVLRSALDKKDVQYSRRVWDFQTVADKVRLIEQDTIPVLVMYDPAAYNELLGRITQATKFGRGIPRNLWQRLQPHLVTVNRHAQSDLMSQLVPDQLWLWIGTYDELKGIGGAIALNPDYLISQQT
jgi:CRISPR-associated endonuclease/helicase Cas3